MLKLREAYQPAYNAGTVDELTNQIRGDLNSHFTFGDSDFNVYIVSDERQEAEYRKLIDQIVPNMEDGESFVNEAMEILEGGKSERNAGSVLYVGRRGTDLDYLMVLPDLYIFAPLTLGEETTHGEYMTEHAQDSFSDIVYEFVGGLGLLHIDGKLTKHVRQLIGPTRPVLPEIRGNELWVDQSHIVGYQVASQYMKRTGGKNGREIFHCSQEPEVWRIVNSVLIPNIIVPIPSDFSQIVKRVEEELTSRCENLGLDIKPDIYIDDSVYRNIRTSSPSIL
jgi:hypothetical protein